MPRKKKREETIERIQERPPMCSLDNTLDKVVRACARFGSQFVVGNENVCVNAVLYKNDLERYLYLDEIPEDVFRRTERRVQQNITEVVCDTNNGGNFVRWLDDKIDLDCRIVPESCDRFRGEILGGAQRIIRKYEGIVVGADGL